MRAHSDYGGRAYDVIVDVVGVDVVWVTLHINDSRSHLG
jgi:hypothetical protein